MSIQTTPEFEQLLSRAQSMGAITADQAAGYRATFEATPPEATRRVEAQIADVEELRRPANNSAQAQREAAARSVQPADDGQVRRSLGL